ncbi:MAG: asparagine--tRNA ligase [gamma proteobacterium endosymbiont of Trioza apicalis]
MNIVSINDIIKGKIPINNKVIIKSWVRTRRDSKNGLSFLILQDGSCFNNLQAVVKNNIPNYKRDILKLTSGCSVKIKGIIIKSLGPGQYYEIKVKKINIIGWVKNPDTYPISQKKHSVEYLREFAHLRPRTNLISAITRIRHTSAYAIHKFMNKNGFFWISTPLITTYDTEGSGKMFKVSTLDFNNIPYTPNGKINFSKDFFKKETFLTVSGQLNCESYACALSKVYTFGPTFRAEKSNTSKHLAEFWMVEPEIAFAKLQDIINLAEILLKYIFKKILEKRYDDMLFFNKYIDNMAIKRLKNIIDSNFVQIDYTEAINILKKCKKNFKNKILWGNDLFSEHEHYLTEIEFKKPVIIKNYPKDIKPFYMRINKDNKTVASMDILVPNIGEIIGGSQREERLIKLDKRFKETGLNKKPYWWYRDLRNYGTVPHSGFGLGFERLILYITGVKNIRDIIPFPRTTGSANF